MGWLITTILKTLKKQTSIQKLPIAIRKQNPFYPTASFFKATEPPSSPTSIRDARSSNNWRSINPTALSLFLNSINYVLLLQLK